MKLIQYQYLYLLFHKQRQQTLGYFDPFLYLPTQKQDYFCFQSTLSSKLPGCEYFQLRGIHFVEQCLIVCEKSFSP